MGRLKKLTEAQAAQSVDLYRDGLSLGQIAARFGVTRQSMHDLLKRRIELRPQLRFGKDNHFYRDGRRAVDRAQNKLEKAIARGEVVPRPCEVCGTEGTMADGRRLVQAHHDDYSRPLDVRWLCQPCHHEWHKTHTAKGAC